MTNMPHSRIQVARLGECWILIGNSGNLIQQDSTNSFQHGALASGLIAAYHQLGQCNMIANPVGADTVDLVKSLRRSPGLETKFVPDPTEVDRGPLFFRAPRIF